MSAIIETLRGILGIDKAATADRSTPPPVEDKKPVASQELMREEAVPTIGGVRSNKTQYDITGIDPVAMAGLMRRADDGDAVAYLEMAEQLEEKDPHYASVLGTRKRAVAQMDITVQPASDDPHDQELAQLIEDNFIQRETLQDDLLDILDAVGKGFSVTEIIWKKTPELFEVADLKWRPQKWFEFDRIDGVTLSLRGQDGLCKPLTPNKYIIHLHQAKSGVPIRAGVVRTCAWFWMFKNFAIKDWLVFADAYGQPIRLGKYQPGSTPADRAVLMQALRKLGSDAGAMIPEGMSIEFVEAAGKAMSTDMYERLARYCDEQMSKAVLGQTSTTDAMQGGGLAGNQAHNEVRGDISRSDARTLAATLNRQLVRPFIDINRGPQKKYPRIIIGNADVEDINTLSQIADRMARAGAKISQSKMLQRLNLPPAENDADTLMPTPAAPAMMSAQPELAAALQPRDAIDALANEGAGDWEEMIGPLATAVDAEISQAKDMDDLKDRLLKLAHKVDTGPAAKKLAEAMMAARLAGNAGQKLK